LLDVLDGVPLQGAKRLTVSGGDVEAWLVGHFMYVRTSLSLISPGWISTMSSSDGTHAYQMKVTSVLLASKGGSIVPISVKGL
jgi:intracellular multiplication protein IcmK